MSRSVDNVTNEKSDSLYGIEKSKDSFLTTSAQKVNSAVSGVWYEQARSQVQREEVKAVVGYDAHEKFENNLRQEFIKLASTRQHKETFVNQVLKKKALLTMQGVAIIAAYLKEKHRIENLFVCNSLEAMQNKLKEIQSSKKDGRFALVSSNYCEVEDESSESTNPSPEYQSDFNHKVTIGVQKKGSEIKVVVMDALGDDAEDISPRTVLSPVQVLKNTNATGIEVILWYLCQALRPESTKIYYTNIKRQNTYYGCETFALKDALFFLRDPAFFNKIQVETKVLTEDAYRLVLGEIQALPPTFMKGTQSRRVLAEYDEVEVSSSIEEKEKLKMHVASHSVQDGEKQHNYYINHQSFKYHLFVLNVLRVMHEEAIKAVIEKTLLRAYRPKDGDFPKTLSDLHFWQPVTIETGTDGKQYPKSWSAGRGH